MTLSLRLLLYVSTRRNTSSNVMCSGPTCADECMDRYLAAPKSSTSFT
eukprot:CAMPEP_0184657346 /NCGR_PEP_ID=MMETSP0308-20130426/19028_1 /TAXON_ID=38269 /ORGANISM="Gloeochaete witrockiana, Strain SAG 46.84" /LENGTH=47 /DNA_ID= /DNA_START= /DNA_END= /DNA_ORIENTATION=